ncbi:MAG: hypothetical protein KDM91_15445 [Verrucomicrobiae bacterium]|nr:hypothetical protein [Verrucomicrobiae bacterium]
MSILADNAYLYETDSGGQPPFGKFSLENFRQLLNSAKISSKAILIRMGAKNAGSKPEFFSSEGPSRIWLGLSRVSHHRPVF